MMEGFCLVCEGKVWIVVELFLDPICAFGRERGSAFIEIHDFAFRLMEGGGCTELGHLSS
jgi:hypothetical protein